VNDISSDSGGRVPKGLWHGTALQVLGRVWSAACTLAILFLAAERCDAAGFGRFTFYVALFAWLDTLANMGTAQVTIQRTAGDDASFLSVLAAARRIRWRAGFCGVALTAIVAFATREPDAGWIVLASLYPVTHVLELSSTVFRNRLDWRVPVAMRAIASAMSLGFVLLLWTSQATRPALYLVGVALGSTLANFLLHAASRPHLPRATGPIEPARGILRAALPLGISALCAQTYFYADNVFVRAYRGDEELGHYNVAVRLMSWSIMLAQYTSSTALPWFRREHLGGDLGRAVSRITPPLVALAAFGAGCVWPWTFEILELFQPGFGAASASLRWLLGAAVAVYAGAMLLTAVVALGHNRAMLWISAAGMLLNVGANFWAVPALGIEGAGLTTCATECFVALAAAAVLVRSRVPLGAAWRWLLAPAAFVLGTAVSSLPRI
jgi:O-antigen/teichoic acid export membrane protein